MCGILYFILFYFILLHFILPFLQPACSTSSACYFLSCPFFLLPSLSLVPGGNCCKSLKTRAKSVKCIHFYGAANKGQRKEGKGTGIVCLPQFSSCQLFVSLQWCEEHHKRRGTQTFRTKGKFWRRGKPLSEVLLLSHCIWLVAGV